MVVNLLTFTVSIVMSINTNVKMDTIDYWHVLYNNKTIAEFNEVEKTFPIVIKRASIKSRDTLKVMYGKDTPKDDCKTGLYILINYKKIILANGKGNFTPLKTVVKNILSISQTYNSKMIDVYYFDDRVNKLIFQLKIE